MASTAEGSVRRHRTWRLYVGSAFVCLVIVALLVGAWMLYRGMAVAALRRFSLRFHPIAKQLGDLGGASRIRGRSICMPIMLAMDV